MHPREKSPSYERGWRRCDSTILGSDTSRKDLSLSLSLLPNTGIAPSHGACKLSLHLPVAAVIVYACRETPCKSVDQRSGVAGATARPRWPAGDQSSVAAREHSALKTRAKPTRAQHSDGGHQSRRVGNGEHLFVSLVYLYSGIVIIAQLCDITHPVHYLARSQLFFFYPIISNAVSPKEKSN